VAIGNAPTALLALLDLIDEGEAAPALVIGMPVGFVACAESKDELLKRTVPYITILGRRGGSSAAAATVNALLDLMKVE
jgi:precorrin-8X/cobalt-precorrin-8 methylmutase